MIIDRLFDLALVFILLGAGCGIIQLAINKFRKFFYIFILLWGFFGMTAIILQLIEGIK